MDVHANNVARFSPEAMVGFDQVLLPGATWEQIFMPLAPVRPDGLIDWIKIMSPHGWGDACGFYSTRISLAEFYERQIQSTLMEVTALPESMRLLGLNLRRQLRLYSIIHLRMNSGRTWTLVANQPIATRRGTFTGAWLVREATGPNGELQPGLVAENITSATKTVRQGLTNLSIRTDTGRELCQTVQDVYIM